MQSPQLMLPLIDNCVAFCGFGVFQLCGPYLIENYGFSQSEVGHTFMISGVAYIFTTFAVGMVRATEGKILHARSFSDVSSFFHRFVTGPNTQSQCQFLETAVWPCITCSLGHCHSCHSNPEKFWSTFWQLWWEVDLDVQWCQPLLDLSSQWWGWALKTISTPT